MPEFYVILARKMPEFYIIIAQKIFFPEFCPHPLFPPSPTPMHPSSGSLGCHLRKVCKILFQICAFGAFFNKYTHLKWTLASYLV